jgi:hypothetical protein
MEKRYQVFVSSTFADLKEERGLVMKALMEMDCIPAGMELFPAVDEEQWAFIKRVIDDCDYYLLIVGGRYGSITPEGVSYTEKEYDYAVSKGMKVLALLHEKPAEISVSKSELVPEARARLLSFREKVSKGRLVRFWTRAEELPGSVALSLSKTIKTYPAVGWVRASAVASEDILSQLNELRQDNERLKKVAATPAPLPPPAVPDLAGLDYPFELHGTSSSRDGQRRWSCKLTWRQIFGYLSPYLESHPNEALVKIHLTKSIEHHNSGLTGWGHEVNDQDFQTVRIQLRALGLVEAEYKKANNGTMSIFWWLTSQGDRLMVQLRAIRK